MITIIAAIIFIASSVGLVISALMLMNDERFHKEMGYITVAWLISGFFLFGVF